MDVDKSAKACINEATVSRSENAAQYIPDPKFERVVRLVKQHVNLFLTGMGGTGKSVVASNLAKRLISEGFRVACTASTGIAATRYYDHGLRGCTLHSWAAIGKGERNVEDLIKAVRRWPDAMARIKNTDVLMVDEISMISAELWGKIDDLTRAIRENRQEVFGGMTIVIVGDLGQLPPVQKSDGPPANIIIKGREFDMCDFTWVFFDIPYRYSQDLEFGKMLARIRVGKHTDEDIAKLMSRVKPFDDKAAERFGTTHPTTLFATRAAAAALNTRELAKLPGVPMVSKCRDQWFAGRSKLRDMPLGMRNTLDEAIEPVITLKVGAEVFIKKNLDVAANITNWTRAVVTEIVPDVRRPGEIKNVGVRLRDGRSLTMGFSEFDVGFANDDCHATRQQIALKLAYGVTIHGSQGLTLEVAVVDAGERLFEDGQGYVAMSRVKTLDGLFILRLDPTKLRCNSEVMNFVAQCEAKQREKDAMEEEAENSKNKCANAVTDMTSLTEEEFAMIDAAEVKYSECQAVKRPPPPPPPCSEADSAYSDVAPPQRKLRKIDADADVHDAAPPCGVFVTDEEKEITSAIEFEHCQRQTADHT